MTGSPQDPGLIPRLCSTLFGRIEEHEEAVEAEVWQ